MEQLARCSRTLYDKDVCDKANEISKLRASLSKYVPPTVYCTSLQEWHDKLVEMNHTIETDVKKHIMTKEEDQEYDSFGITPQQKESIVETVRMALLRLTSHAAWSRHMSDTIGYSLEGFFTNLRRAGVWNNINNVYFGLRREQLLDIVLNTVSWHLNQELLDSIPTPVVE